MAKRLAAILLLVVGGMVAFATPASAHGEKSQEAFLRMRTVAWTDVQFVGGTLKDGETYVKQGETVVLKGTARLMNTWPDTLAAGAPEIGYINIATQGPCVEMLERSINGVSAPGRIEIARGNYYQFEMKLMGRRPGRWHVHPSFAVKGAGTVLGPGQWIHVERTKEGFSSPVTLYNGKKINMENYGLSMIWIMQIIGFLIGMVWMVWWTVPKFHRTVTNPAVTLQIPLNDDGVAVGLNSKKDHRVVNMITLATAIFLLVGWVYQASAYPVKIPQQVVQFEPPKTALDTAPELAKVDAQSAAYDRDSRALTITINATNVSDTPVTLQEFTTSTLTYSAPGGSATAPGKYLHQMQVSPSGPIQPGQTQKLTLAIDGNPFVDEHLVPTSESQLTVAGLLSFTDSSGKRSFAEIEEPLRPNYHD
jgi:methane/ammonia monooxygenase subunit B